MHDYLNYAPPPHISHVTIILTPQNWTDKSDLIFSPLESHFLTLSILMVIFIRPLIGISPTGRQVQWVAD